MAIIPERSNTSAIYSRYNGQIWFVPTTNWQLATSAIVRSTRFILPDVVLDQLSSSIDTQTFAHLYAAHIHSPVLWYTPTGMLGDEIYNFLHRLPGIGNVCILREQPEQGLQALDKKNLEAMLAESWDWKRVPPFITRNESNFHEFDLPKRQDFSGTTGEDDLYQESSWLNLHRRLDQVSPKQPIRLPRVVIVVPTTPYFACTLVPLTAYIQGIMLFLPYESTMHEYFIGELVRALLEDDDADEVWLTGPASKLKNALEQALNKKRLEQKRFDRAVAVRVIPGNDHFSVSEQVAVLLLTYRYLDSMLIETLTHPEGREYFFDFLSSVQMRSLYHHCNRMLDLAGQLRRKNFQAIKDIHNVYWRMLDHERRDFICHFREWYADVSVVTNNIAVVADYNADEVVPHNLIDAAAFAAYRGAPLLLLRPLPSETSYYIGSLMDKTEDQLEKLNELQVERSKLDAKHSINNDLTETEQGWQEFKPQIETIKKRITDLRSNLRDNVYKTGEVLYESLVPLAVRNTLHQLHPQFLAVFIQDPSLPVELIRESENIDTDRIYERSIEQGHTNNLKEKVEESYDRFWSLRYAIGHISSINLYETNLTNNISFFTPRANIENDVRVLLCSDPTRDLSFSHEEAEKLTNFLEGWEIPIGNRQVKLVVHHLDNNHQETGTPTREHLVTALRQGYDIVHYSGHAFFDNVLPGRSGLLLSDGVLTAADVRFMLDLGRNPIIYANACSAGRIKNISSRFTGLAAAFIRAGAAGYISSLWSIDDRDAAALSIAYYQALLKNDSTIGECLRAAKVHARENFLQTKSDFITWASLVLYGDPMLSLVRSANETSPLPKEETHE